MPEGDIRFALELEFRALVSCLTTVTGIQLRSPGEQLTLSTTEPSLYLLKTLLVVVKQHSHFLIVLVYY